MKFGVVKSRDLRDFSSAIATILCLYSTLFDIYDVLKSISQQIIRTARSWTHYEYAVIVGHPSILGGRFNDNQLCFLSLHRFFD